jgi:cell division GTPase FtsZ
VKYPRERVLSSGKTESAEMTDEKTNKVLVEEIMRPGAQADAELERHLVAPSLDPAVLERLRTERAELLRAKRDKETAPAPAARRTDRSLNFGVVGLGQAGSRIAEVFHDLGYDACAINTATQDLEFIGMPEDRKLFLPFALGGAGKELDNGRQAVEQNAEAIMAKLHGLFGEGNEMMLLAVSGGGGTGSGGAEAIVGLMSTLGKPVGVIYVLPMDTEDSLTKHNAVTTLGKLAKMASADAISTLIVVDNAKIELLYPGLSKAAFWPAANRAIVEPLHLFNSLSAMATPYDSLDAMDFSRIFTAGDCLIYGMMEVLDYKETTAIAEAVMGQLEGSLLAGDFNLKEARFGGLLVVGSPNAMASLPAENIHYAAHMVSEACDYAQLTRGVYQIPDIGDDVVRVYTMFSGLGLPAARIDILKQEAEEQMRQIHEKEKTRASRMEVDYGAGTGTVAKAQEIRRLIQKDKSGFGRLTTNANRRPDIIDRRRR